jgi:hypothetical protein
VFIHIHKNDILQLKHKILRSIKTFTTGFTTEITDDKILELEDDNSINILRALKFFK